MLIPEVVGLGRMWRACTVCPPEHPGGCGYCDCGRVVYGYRAGVSVGGVIKCTDYGDTFDEACGRAMEKAIRWGYVDEALLAGEVADA